MRRKKLFAAAMAAMLAISMTAPALAVPARDPETGKKAANQSEKAQSGEQPAAKASTGKGAFTGSTALAKYLYQKMEGSPASVAVPISKLSGKSSQAMFDEIGDAAEEAFIQNGLIDHITDMSFSYRSDSSNVQLKLSYNITSQATRTSRASALAKKADEIIASVVTADMNDEQKATALYNYVSANTAYDFAALNDFIDRPNGKAVYDRQTAYSALVDKKAICQGFSRAYKLLCDRAGVPCVVVFGTVNSNGIAHSWNRIKVDGAWRTVDTTNSQLRISGQNGIYAVDGSMTANKQSIVDSKAKEYY